MSQLQISTTKIILASTEQVYQIIADYNLGHPKILPKPYFESLVVEKGGIGAGTIIRFKMKVLGRQQEFRAEISEPEPGRVLVERDLDTSGETTFCVDPQPDNESVRVTITTTMEIRSGLFSTLEGWFTKRLLTSIYEKELEQLAVIATEGIEQEKWN